MQQAHSIGEAVRMGGQETVDSALLVYRLLHSFSTNKVSTRNISGPVGIIGAALGVARLGLGNFLLFLTLLSANLAVINFLPIPILDGGHMVLLAYEGIRGKPADERVQEVLTWIGLLLLLTLMIWAFGLDLGFFSRPGRIKRIIGGSRRSENEPCPYMTGRALTLGSFTRFILVGSRISAKC